jgi:hypothetical protein
MVPYYAGFSEAFVARVLAIFARSRTAHILDPWNGSGTTTRVARDLGFEAIGVDLGPVPTLVASAKLASIADASRARRLAADISAWALARHGADVREQDPLLEWMPPQAAQYARLVQRRISRLPALSGDRCVDPLVETLPPVAAFLTLCLVRAVRRRSAALTGSNPTWQKRPRGKTTPTDLATAFLADVQLLAEGLCPNSDGIASIVRGDACALPVPDAWANLLITSPPYCTRLDYVVGSSLELAVLGLSPASPNPFRRRVQVAMERLTGGAS